MDLTNDTQLPPQTFNLTRSRDLGLEIFREDLAWQLSDGHVSHAVSLRDARGDQTPLSPRRAVVIFHGIESHPGWFFGTAGRICRAGWDVFLPVRRGSGSDPRDRGHAHSAERLLLDVDEIFDQIQRAGPYKAICAVGISWGGKLLTAWALDPNRQARLARMTLVSPGICPVVDVSWSTKLAIGASLILQPKRRFAIPLGDPGLFTDDETFQEFIRNDPLRLHQATARFLLASRLLDAKLARARPGSIRIPTGLILSTQDRIIDAQATVERVEKLTETSALVRRGDWPHTPEFAADPCPYYRAVCETLGISEPVQEARPG